MQILGRPAAQRDDECRYPAVLMHGGMFVHLFLHLEESRAALVDLLVEASVLQYLHFAPANQSGQAHSFPGSGFCRHGPIDKGTGPFVATFHQNLE